uniref:Uncharacterized protein n=1 Tax=Haemonchus contortus TaxID=6289 RepID=A0A7I4YIH3_HAECO|nr:unnamed protein product [Haemonchus contortus]
MKITLAVIFTACAVLSAVLAEVPTGMPPPPPFGQGMMPPLPPPLPSNDTVGWEILGTVMNPTLSREQKKEQLMELVKKY